MGSNDECMTPRMEAIPLFESILSDDTYPERSRRVAACVVQAALDDLVRIERLDDSLRLRSRPNSTAVQPNCCAANTSGGLVRPSRCRSGSTAISALAERLPTRNPCDVHTGRREPGFRSRSTTWSRACERLPRGDESRWRRSGVRFDYAFTEPALRQLQQLEPWSGRDSIPASRDGRPCPRKRGSWHPKDSQAHRGPFCCTGVPPCDCGSKEIQGDVGGTPVPFELSRRAKHRRRLLVYICQ